MDEVALIILIGFIIFEFSSCEIKEIIAKYDHDIAEKKLMIENGLSYQANTTTPVWTKKK